MESNGKNNNEIVIIRVGLERNETEEISISNLLFATTISSTTRQLEWGQAFSAGDVERITGDNRVIPSRKEELSLFLSIGKLREKYSNLFILQALSILVRDRKRERDRNGTNNEGQHGWGISQGIVSTIIKWK